MEDGLVCPWKKGVPLTSVLLPPSNYLPVTFRFRVRGTTIKYGNKVRCKWTPRRSGTSTGLEQRDKSGLRQGYDCRLKNET